MDQEVDVAALETEGRSALAAGNLNLALNHLSKAVRIAPKAQLWLDLAQVYESLGRGNAYIVYLSKALAELEHKPRDLIAKLASCKQGFLEANPNVIDVQRLYVKNPQAPRIKQERAEFFKMIDKGESLKAFEIGYNQYEKRRVDPLIQGVWCSLASRNGQMQMGLNAAFAAFVWEPHNWITLTNIGDILGQLRKAKPALDFSLAAVNLRPNLPVAWINLSAAFENLGQHWEAAKACREALKLNPRDGLAWTNLGNSLKNSGRSAEATEAFREAVKMQPDNVALWSNLLFGILYDETASQEQIAAETFKFGEYWEPKIKPLCHRDRLRGPIPEKLRIGFVSADIRSHPVAYFFEPLLEHIDRQEFEVYIYNNYLTDDLVTKRFRGYADKWVDVAGLRDAEFVKRVMQDKVDILVDMSGHTARNRLLAFAQRPAPVQVTWLGHPATSGLTRMDWRITDHNSDPVGSDLYYTERLARLDCASCYAPLVKDPALRFDAKYHVNPAPALLNGFVTFGSCNNLAKVNPSVVNCWSQVLKAVPNSKLLLESPGLSQVEFRKKVLSDFAENGIEPERLLLYNRDSKLQYLRYQEIDIALDPFPYGGGTTTLDLLWMGLPMVTLLVDRPMGRTGSSVLKPLGNENWIARTIEEYVSIAVGLAEDPIELNQIRFVMRPRLEASPLMNGPRYAEQFGRACREMYVKAASNA